MRKILIILTEVFPYDLGESFLENEIEYMRGFNEVLCIPCSDIKCNHKRKIDNSSVKVIDLKKNSFSQSKLLKLVRYLYALFSKMVIMEIIYLLKTKRFTISKLKILLSYVSIGNQNIKLIKKVLNEQKYSENDKIIFYSYWMHFHAYVAVKLGLNFPNSLVVSRCHRFDLYEYINKDNYIPLRKFILEGVDMIFSISDDGKNYIESEYPIFKTNVIVSRLGTRDYGFKNEIEDVSPFRIVSCSWISPVKRIHRIVETLALIKDIQIEWTHLGGGDFIDNIDAMCKTNLGSNIKYNLVGALTNSEIIDFYKNNDFHVFVNVSESEGIPVSIMEALSFGIPVIATDVGGVREIVYENYNGFLLHKDFNNHDLIKLIYKISSISQEDYKQLREQARLSWCENYNATINYTQFVKYIDN